MLIFGNQDLGTQNIYFYWVVVFTPETKATKYMHVYPQTHEHADSTNNCVSLPLRVSIFLIYYFKHPILPVPIQWLGVLFSLSPSVLVNPFSNSKKLYVFVCSVSLCVIDLSAMPAAFWPSRDSMGEENG